MDYATQQGQSRTITVTVELVVTDLPEDTRVERAKSADVATLADLFDQEVVQAFDLSAELCSQILQENGVFLDVVEANVLGRAA